MTDNTPTYTPTRVELSDGTTILMEVANDPYYDGPVSVQELQIRMKDLPYAGIGLMTNKRENIVAN